MATNRVKVLAASPHKFASPRVAFCSGRVLTACNAYPWLLCLAGIYILEPSLFQTLSSFFSRIQFRHRQFSTRTTKINDNIDNASRSTSLDATEDTGRKSISYDRPTDKQTIQKMFSRNPNKSQTESFSKSRRSTKRTSFRDHAISKNRSERPSTRRPPTEEANPLGR